MSFHIIIPARFASSRLPGKLLLDIKGKSLIERVYEQALKCGAKSVVIATDDERIEKTAKEFGAIVCRTSVNHSTGTDRLAEAVDILGLQEEDIVVNLQGDEPLVPPFAVEKLVQALKNNPNAFMTTVCTAILDEEQLVDPNVVKVVVDKDGFALYFSRSMIPYPREKHELSLVKNHFYRHIGLYGYRINALKRYPSFPKAPAELIEHLEQLRILWQGEKIHVSVIEQALPPGVDTMAELEKVRMLF
jgi:3-deoxy-manno-octulosonate cytidylyltransferase (CMP-KDO synthetase)